jgi:transposase
VIARQLGVSRRLIYYLITTGQLDRDLAEPLPRRTRMPHPTKLDLYQPIITTRLATYPELSAVRLFDECRAAGYTGSLTQLKHFVRQVRPRPEPEPVVRFETAPGHQAQVDFADFHFPWGKRYALLVVLGYSRLLWLRFFPRKTMRTLMAGLEEAFAYFGGVTAELLFDQMKGVILDDQRAVGGKLFENPEFLRFAAHWDFRIRACRPYRAQTKGKIERPVSYVRGNFAYGREFLGDDDVDAQRLVWLDQTANARVHGTTKEVPRIRFERDERHVLHPVAPAAYHPLVLPPERLTRATAASSRRSRSPKLHLAVERRQLIAYAQLVEHFGEPFGEPVDETLEEVAP